MPVVGMPRMFSGGAGACASIASHAVIALWVVPRNKAFVAPEPMHALPRQLIAKRLFREQLIEPARSRATRKADRKPTAARRGQFGNPSSDPVSQSFGILAYLDRSSRHLHSLRSRTRRAADRGDGAGIIGCMEHVGTGDDRVRSRFGHLPGVVATQAPVYLDHRVETALVAQTPQCADLHQHLRQELLPAKARID